MTGRKDLVLLLGAGIFLFYGVIAILWVSGSPVMHWMVENIWGVDPVIAEGHWYAKNPMPLFDLEGTLSWRDCYLRGFDVMTKNPCDPMGRPSNYSPFWYLLPTGGAANTFALGLVLDGLFLAALPFLLAPRSWVEFWFSLLAATSHAALFAVERANIDILMFLMMLGTIWLWRREQFCAGFVLVMAAGLLKFYPWALLVLFANQPPRRLAGYALTALLVMAAFGLAFHRELALIPSLMPHVSYFGSQFGAEVLPIGMIENLGLAPSVKPVLELILIAAACWTAWQLSSRLHAASVPIPWTAPRFSLLLGGSAIVCGCFILMASVNYRAIFLLAVLPGFFTLTQLFRQGLLARLAKAAVWATLFCLYTESFRKASLGLERLLYGGDPGDLWHELPEVIYFVFREAVWWFLIIMLLGLLMAWLRQAPILASLGMRRAVLHEA